MKINNIILKGKTIKVLDFPPDSKMNIETSRNIKINVLKNCK